MLSLNASEHLDEIVNLGKRLGKSVLDPGESFLCHHIDVTLPEFLLPVISIGYK